MRASKVRRKLMAAGALSLLLTTMGAVPTLASAPIRPLGLSHADRLAALSTMLPKDRALLTARFSSDRYLVLGYARTVQRFDERSGRPMGPSRNLALTDLAPAATSGITNLVLTISVTYDRESPCCYWDIYNTFDWTGKPPNNGAGKDHMGTAWANGLSLWAGSNGAFGWYTNGPAISFNTDDITPNAGFDEEFYECNTSYCISYANWGYVVGTMHWTVFRSQPTDVVFKYFHTYASTTYSIGISGTGPSISISPTSDQTSTAVSTNFYD
jgi:hypothetical protein